MITFAVTMVIAWCLIFLVSFVPALFSIAPAVWWIEAELSPHSCSIWWESAVGFSAVPLWIRGNQMFWAGNGPPWLLCASEMYHSLVWEAKISSNMCGCLIFANPFPGRIRVFILRLINFLVNAHTLLCQKGYQWWPLYFQKINKSTVLESFKLKSLILDSSTHLFGFYFSAEIFSKD